MISTRFASMLNIDVEIKRPILTEDKIAGFATTYKIVGVVRGRISRGGGTEKFIGAQHQADVSHVLYVLGGTDIGRDDQVVAKGIEYRVKNVRNPSQLDHHLECDLELIQVD